MTSPHLKQLRDAAKLFKKLAHKTFGKKCADYNWDCYACRAWRVVEDFDTLVHQHLATEEETAAYLKKFEATQKRFAKKK